MAEVIGDSHLYKAIIDKLRADTGSDGLKVLTGHVSSRDYRIGRHQPNNTSKERYLGVHLPLSVPLIRRGYAGHVQKTLARFYCSAKTLASGELTASKIADRLDTLLLPEQGSGQSANRSFLNFSDASITCMATTRLSRVGARFTDGTDLWTLWVDAEVIWRNKSCPS
jgi:hypothetical protein